MSFDFDLTGVQSFLAPFITAQPLTQIIGQGATATLSVSAGGASPLRYQWRFNGAAITGATNAALIFASAQIANSGNYTVVITNIAGAMTSTIAAITVESTDADNDGMPDAWELTNGLLPNINDANLDADGDGMTNLDEFNAGTDPQSALSSLRVELISAAGTSATLRFHAASNHAYSVLYRDTLPGSQWTKLLNVPAHTTNRTATAIDANATNAQRFYRLVTPALP